MIQPSLDFNPASDTSREANVYNLPNRSRDKQRALDALTEAGEQGLTDFQLAERMTLTGTWIGQTSAGKRRLDLEREGLVARRLVIGPDLALVPDKRPSPTGAMAGVYTLIEWSVAR